MTPQDQPSLTPPPQQQKSSALPWVVGCCVALLLAVIVLCGGYALYRFRSAGATNEHQSGVEPSGGSQSTEAQASPAESNSVTPPPPPVAGGSPTAWETTAQGVTGDAGTTFTLSCPAGGSLHSVWGSDIYTADSSICTAAVHVGLITVEQGGTVTIEVRPGRPVYGASQRNGVTTNVYGGFGRSFLFRSEPNSRELEADDVIPILWSTSASMLTYENGKPFKFKCPAEGRESTVWGTDVYTADSSICTAAVHAGALRLESGGDVTIELRPGQSSYQGTLRNNVKSTDYGSYSRSFVVK